MFVEQAPRSACARSSFRSRPLRVAARDGGDVIDIGVQMVVAEHGSALPLPRRHRAGMTQTPGRGQGRIVDLIRFDDPVAVPSHPTAPRRPG